MIKFLSRQLARADRQTYAALAVIAGVFLLFFYPVFFESKYFVINDAFVDLYPLRTVMWDELRHGRLPLWTPLVLSGYPILSMAQNAVGYPLTWGHLFLPAPWAEQIYTLTPYLLTPAFVYGYLRKIKRSRFASLLGGLTFGYGGLMVSAVANNGLLPNAVMWLPLILIATECARTRPFLTCLLGATGAYTMSVLTGVGQGFLYVGVIAVSYALFLVIAADWLPAEDSIRYQWKDPKRWRPLAVVIAAILLSAGVAAFQILETMRAARLSIRRVLSYDLFTEGAYTLSQSFKAFLFPLHYVNNATPWVPPLAMLLAMIAVIAVVRDPNRDFRILFWLVLAVAGWLLMLGPNTPIFVLLYRVPILNSFRAPARNAFEWTFAIGILAAYGWDAARHVWSSSERAGQRERAKAITAITLLFLDLLVMILWRWDFARVAPLWDESNHYPAYPENRYLAWKIVFTLLAIAAVWVGARIRYFQWRSALLAAAIVLVCFAEPSIMASRWWWPALKTRDQFTAPSATTKFLQLYQPEQYRIYTRANLWREEYEPRRRLDPGNLTMLHHLRNVGGYEPLMLERYSRALGNVWMDASSPLRGYEANTSLFYSRSHVLDILNASFVIGYSDLSTEFTPPLEKAGIRFRESDLGEELGPGESDRLEGTASDCDTLAIVSSLSNSGPEAQGAVVARLQIVIAGGRVIEREMRAGIDTAEWAHDRSDVLRSIRHQLAPVFESFADDEEHIFLGHRYWTRISLGEPVRIAHLGITNVSQHASLRLSKITLHNSATGWSTPLPDYDRDRWEPLYQKDGVEIIRNKRVLPRVWLVAEAEAVDSEEALSRIRGESKVSFDPRRTALVEVSLDELPTLKGGPVSPEASARLVSAESNNLTIETTAPTPSILIVSEVNYPGWEATVDGNHAAILNTDYLLRGVSLPAGSHQVTMVYRAPGARSGALISLASLVIILAMGIYYCRKISLPVSDKLMRRPR